MRIWDNAPLRMKGFVVIGIPLMPLVVTGGLFLLGAKNAGTASDWMGRATLATTQISTVLRLVGDADASVSGFLLQGDRAALAPFEHAYVALPPEIARLKTLVWDSPEQIAHVEKIAAMAARHPLARVVDAAVGSPDHRVPEPLLSEGRAAIESLRREAYTMQVLQDRLIADRTQLTRRVLVALAVGGALFGLLFGVLGMMAFMTGVVRRIDRLRADAEHLAHGDPLGAPHDASDELGELSRSMHEAARLLRAREEKERAAARALADANQQLERHAAELSAVNEELEAFSYSVSHDLRAPLRHVTGFASLLQRSAADRLVETESRYIRTIVEAATRMGRLIDDLLAFSRMGRTPIEHRRVSLAEVVRDAREDVPHAATAAAIAWTVHPLPDVDGDPALLRQVFVNLLSNAVKYSGAQPQPAVEVGVQPGGPDETVIYVRDNGVGFDMAYVDKLFGVFQRLHTSDAFEGTGIGLANVRRIVHRHGGRVWAEGAVDAGATFYVSLPQTGAA
jgi:signal transduction histidine kinase